MERLTFEGNFCDIAQCDVVDAANYLMFRFMFPMPGEFFKTTDDSGSVGTVGTPLNMEGGRL